MALITLMVFNALIMAISLSQPNSPHSINETPGLQSIKKTPGLLHSISTQRHTTFEEAGSDPGITSSNHTLDQTYDQTSQFILSDTQTPRDSTSPPPPDQELSPDSWVPTQTKCSHLTLGFLHRRSAKQSLPTATAAPQPPGHGNIFFCSIII